MDWLHWLLISLLVLFIAGLWFSRLLEKAERKSRNTIGHYIEIADTILSCPFCGGEPRVYEWTDEISKAYGYTPNYEIECSECNISTDVDGDVRFALERWNSRTASAENRKGTSATPVGGEE
jgi:Lar family restriction alleviation protein